MIFLSSSLHPLLSMGKKDGSYATKSRYEQCGTMEILLNVRELVSTVVKLKRPCHAGSRRGLAHVARLFRAAADTCYYLGSRLRSAELVK